MLDKLKNHYKEALTTDLSLQSGYMWFTGDTGEPFGIKQNVLSDSELQLLQSIFDRYENETIYRYTPVQLKWKNILSGKNISDEQEFYRFIHFFSKQPILDHISFSEAVSGLFPEETVMLLNEDNKSGVIIETSKQTFNDTPYESLKDTLSTDFYIDLSIYIGLFQTNRNLAKEVYNRERNDFLSIKDYLEPKAVYTIADLLPLMLIQSASPDTRNTLTGLLAGLMEEDKETVQTIKVFVECNMNTTLAAKKLYIHRNSLQYRVDKFYERTGIDVKQFKNALSVYIAILSLEQF
ncbi:PucR family transcriptional regulator [Fictibacillus phosphorivorans]|uniref:PucR family transcriptional regulator n=1 Tax=Fictibacillus phosphorivorans TaxID=1221500 RepID=UPI00203FCFFF|nr:helix-turn-helix domain-containing protein [Fictibacillus phosphorivorans]MCM3717520.1 helix-turn-helix domain-containing protein [Fictibacillus phosphorivorans]MCM3775215.1 helix-turn-helix domain-containing protein [Fictibacillus phosphorivorans]